MTINNEYCWMHKPGGWTCPECAQEEDLQPAPALQPGQFEREVAFYGVPYGAIQIKRAVAEKLAQQMEGKYVNAESDLSSTFLFGINLNDWTNYPVHCHRIISTRLEDDTADGSKGRVIAVCEPVDRKG